MGKAWCGHSVPHGLTVNIIKRINKTQSTPLRTLLLISRMAEMQPWQLQGKGFGWQPWNWRYSLKPAYHRCHVNTLQDQSDRFFLLFCCSFLKCKCNFTWLWRWAEKLHQHWTLIMHHSQSLYSLFPSQWHLQLWIYAAYASPLVVRLTCTLYACTLDVVKAM